MSDPSALAVVRTWEAEGAYIDARLTGSAARVVVASYPGRIGPRRQATPSSAAESPTWLPEAVLRDRASGERTRRALVECRDVTRPAEFSGLRMLSVVTVDLASGLPPTDAQAVMTDGEIVYASAESLYVATERWSPPLDHAGRASTAIHKFDISEPSEAQLPTSLGFRSRR